MYIDHNYFYTAKIIYDFDWVCALCSTLLKFGTCAKSFSLATQTNDTFSHREWYEQKTQRYKWKLDQSTYAYIDNSKVWCDSYKLHARNFFFV